MTTSQPAAGRVTTLPPEGRRGGSSRGQIRGSSLVLAGRVLSLGLNFAVQVLIVRYLSKADYGAFAYALSLALFAHTLIMLALDRAVVRFIPIYDEEGAHDKALGALIFAAATVVGLGLLLIAVVFVLAGPLGVSLGEGKAESLVLILIAFAPLEAMNTLFVGLFAVLSRPTAIFFRRYVMTAALRLAAALVLVLASSDVEVLAIGYVLTAAVGVAASALIFVQIARSEGLVAKYRSVSPRMPAREILSFTVPMLTTDLVYAAILTSDVVLLGHFKGVEEVASLRAILPAAQMNQIVFASFLFLFTPAVARLFARGDRRGVDDIYWHTAGWITSLTAPIFLLTFSLAAPLTTLLFGVAYADSAIILAVLALGYYGQAAVGFNGTTLMVFGKMRVIVALNVAAVVVNLAANLVAIPLWGALGAGIATSTTLLVHNVLKQTAVHRVAGVRFFAPEYARLYVAVLVAAVSLLIVQVAVDQLLVSLALGLLASVLVLGISRHLLRVPETFPELLKVPLVGRFLAQGAAR
jgi:O-antigen/teichoic acid export membrane protein